MYEELSEIEKKNPKLKRQIKPIKRKAREIQVAIKKGIKTQVEITKESTRKENLYLSLMSLQDYAIEIAHVIRTGLHKIKSRAEFIKDKYPDSKYDRYYKIYSVEIFSEMVRLNNALDFMLSYAKSNIEIEEFNIKDVILNVFDNYRHILEKKKT